MGDKWEVRGFCSQHEIQPALPPQRFMSDILFAQSPEPAFV